MATTERPESGHVFAGDATTNGAGPHPGTTIPEEVKGWTRYEIPPEVLEHARQTFDLEEYLAEVREIEKTGGVRFEDFIGEIEETSRCSTTPAASSGR